MMDRESENAEPVYLVIRYDDYGAAYSPACPARFEVERTLHEVTVERGWPWLCAITPQQSIDPHDVRELRTVSLAADPARIALLHEAVSTGLCEPAAHGLTHHTWRRLPRYGTEFVGLSAESQCRILREAKREVEEYAGRSVSVFVPPWNSYDEATVQAAGQAGFRFLSGGLNMHVPGPSQVCLIPSTVEWGCLRDLMVRGYRFPPGTVVIALMHATDFVTMDCTTGYLDVKDFGLLADRVVRHFGMEVVPLTGLPDLLAESELRRRSQRAVRLFRSCEPLATIPLLGLRWQRCLLPYTAGLMPGRWQRQGRRGLIARLAGWFAVVVLLPIILGLLVVESAKGNPWASVVLGTMTFLGLTIIAHSGRNAYLKHWRRQWDSGTVGWRTWTGLASGTAMVFAGLLALCLHW